ncbi:glycogen debranching protein [uncultured Imperialibacter sp.]|uniref:alpha-L-rhamnosidase-related protein n=1 Tax=uncultured Imperialibacter sp. TaxID=1672639 RepID=UPI0030D9220D|tara:strand:+ start:90213 stop:92606 length:2394 start_codon:yes stop_codon:yes gene_type:complete
MKQLLYFLLISLAFASCDTATRPISLLLSLDSVEHISGKPEYLGSPFVTAGARVYMIGHQDGSFPDLGWHVSGEMGGIWDHPIKLMDGFSLNVKEVNGEDAYCLDKADEFVNYPFANKHIFRKGDLLIQRTQFVPDDAMEGLIVEYAITNQSEEEKSLELAFTGMVDLRPVWLAERKNIEDGRDTLFLQELSETYLGKDLNNDWYTIFGSSESVVGYRIDESPCPQERKGLGTDGTIVSRVTIEPNETYPVQYYIAGSYTSADEAHATYDQLKGTASVALKNKMKRYEQIAQASSISIPDKDIETMYSWVKYNTAWLVRDVPEIGRGVSAGLPDYPWWFGADNCYTLQGMLATGSPAEVNSTINLIEKLSMELNGNGRIIHETSTNGETYNPGNLNETPQFISLLWTFYQWTGHKETLEKYYPEVKKGISWIEAEDKDGNGYPDGPGMMEIHGLHSEMVDVVVYTQQAYETAAQMAIEMGEPNLGAEYQKKADVLKKKINSEWWVEPAQSFADFRSTKAQALELIDAAIVRADTINKPWSIKELEQTKKELVSKATANTSGYVVHHNWVVNTPTEMGIADPEKADMALATARRYSNRFGMYVTGMDRDEASDASSKWKSFSYVGAVMTLPTGVQAISEARYGHPNEALGYLKKLHNSFSYALPGSMYEVSPDYGMIVQAWNIYAVAVPVVNYFFGIQPEAHKKQVTMAPDMPEGWDNVSISNVLVGDNVIGLAKRTKDSLVTYQITQRNPDWTVLLKLSNQATSTVLVNGKVASSTGENNYVTITLTGSDNVVSVQQ